VQKEDGGLDGVSYAGASMTDDQEHWSEASALLRAHGKCALQHASFKVTEHMHAGDDAEMLRWFEIHERIAQALAETPAWPTD
jgi:hypothetical protein